MSPSHSLLVVDDDEPTRLFLSDNLRADAFQVWTADGANTGMRAIEARRPDLVVLDLLLGDGHGLDVLDRVRASDGLACRIDPTVAVIVLSGRCGDADRTRSLRRGADDHLCKPFSYAELLARIQAILRRARTRPRRGVVRVGALAIDPLSRTARIGERPLQLSVKEYTLLLTLASDPLRVFDKHELLRDVWGYRAASGRTRTIDAHASRLRKKLGCDEGRRWLVNVRGVGYRLTDGPLHVDGKH